MTHARYSGLAPERGSNRLTTRERNLGCFTGLRSLWAQPDTTRDVTEPGVPESRCSQAKVNRKRFACTGCCLFSTGEDGLKPQKSASSTATEVAWVPRAKARNLLSRQARLMGCESPGDHLNKATAAADRQAAYIASLEQSAECGGNWSLGPDPDPDLGSWGGHPDEATIQAHIAVDPQDETWRN